MDLRVIKTKGAIQEAFLALRTKKPLEKIRVKELCEAAQINKSTFYTHYQDIYALNDAVEEQLVQSILERVGQLRSGDLRGRPEWLTRELFHAFVEHADLVQTFFDGPRRALLIDRIEGGLRAAAAADDPAYWADPVRRVLLSFCVQGSYYAFMNNSGQMQDETLVRLLGAAARAAQNIGPAAQAAAPPEPAGSAPAAPLPTREEAERLLREAKARYDAVSRVRGRWDDHCRTAARCAGAIAARCPGLDPDRAYVLGLLHDIGRWYGDGHLCHVYHGWRYMQQLGYPDAARICLTHSFQIQRLDSYVGSFDIPPEAVAELDAALSAAVYDSYDLLIQLCDCLAGPDGPVDMAARMEDVRRRYGSYPQDKWDRNFELKGYFEHWAGAPLYDIVGRPGPL